jgi:hypothetical protein
MAISAKKPEMGAGTAVLSERGTTHLKRAEGRGATDSPDRPEKMELVNDGTSTHGKGHQYH